MRHWRFVVACCLHSLADRVEHTDTVRVVRHEYERQAKQRRLDELNGFAATALDRAYIAYAMGDFMPHGVPVERIQLAIKAYLEATNV